LSPPGLTGCGRSLFAEPFLWTLKSETLSGVGRGCAAPGVGVLAPVTLPALNDKAPKDLKTVPSPTVSLTRSTTLLMTAVSKRMLG
jgi:hypothetical protein